jgi:hypothetical protein
MFTNRKTLITLVLLAFTAAFAAAPIAGEDNSSKAWSTKFAGTYFYESGAITTIHADGTSSTVGSKMFSDDTVESRGGRRETPRQGVWRMVNANTIRVTQLAFLTAQYSHDYVPDGIIEKISWTMKFDREVNGVFPSYTAKNILFEIFLQGQNPTIDEPVGVLPIIDVGLKGYRLQAKLSPEEEAQEAFFESLKGIFKGS